VNEQLRLIIELQSIDTNIISIRKNIEIIPLKIANDQKELKSAQQSYESALKDLQALEKKKKEKERNIEELDIKMTKLKGKVSEIKTNKEYQAYLKEIDNMTKDISRAEDDVLSIMESIDEFKKVVELKKNRMKEEEKELEDIKNKLELEKTKCDENLQLLLQKRKELVGSIKKDIYEQYINLLKTHNGQAVVEVKDEICYGCNLHIPPQQYVQIKNNKEIFACPQCHRILYYKKQEELIAPAS